ncbi:aldolase/citrate lyase family protein [Sphingomonas sp. LY29]|uniref:aldolase/citrate lyase family protein n=1 Tax=Sphingomonas sp. LY29 TaxID=3095341 RepID=UPI002D78883E|nr:aldolase/citrate lyase family protein [Sphingomonas sp. LY29]WRP25797.1 aldolase/citrate lyase family protein [Sphingomonas sp. LY29]
MNRRDRTMLDLLQRGRDEFGFLAVKAEFEAEGTRRHELLRLSDLARRAGLDVALKIGGCEALSDLQDARDLNVDLLVAPMVETPFALSKYIAAKDRTHGDDDCRFLFIVETATALSNIDALIDVAAGRVDGIVFGRIDFSLSCGLTRDDADGEAVTEAAVCIARSCAERDLEFIVGGGLSERSLPLLEAARRIRLDRFESRKVVFDASVLESGLATAAIDAGAAFEREWLLAKRERYLEWADEDRTRLALLDSRVER